MKLTRFQFYLWSWNTPTTRIAEVLGMSATWVFNQTRKYDIPTPPRGYWQKLEAGKEVRRLPLTNPADVRLTDVEVDAEVYQGLSLDPAHGFAPQGENDAAELERTPVERIDTVMQAPHASHVLALAEAFRRCEEARRMLAALEARIGTRGPREQLLGLAWIVRARTALDDVDPSLCLLQDFQAACADDHREPAWLWAG